MSDKNYQTTINVREKAALIWNIADQIQGVYKPHEYGNVILPMTVIKRFDDTLRPTKKKVLEVYQKVKHLEVKDGFLETASGYSFYNISNFDFKELLADPDNIEENFREYLNGFSENVQDIIANFEFDNEIKKLADNNLLYLVISEFNDPKKAYFGADKIKAVDMGYVFEELVRKFSESYDEDAGEYFTSRDIIYLMTDLLISEDKDILIDEGVAKTVYDMAMGTSQMLSCMEERLTQLDSDADIRLFGQELNPKTYAIAKSDMLIRGKDAENMRKGNTLSEDQFKDYTFDYIISNPPFGRKWEVAKNEVVRESKLGDLGRFGVGLPKISDSQMLFDLNGLKKLKETGKMAIIHNSSPLYYSTQDNGANEIRKYYIENDWLETIIQLPNNCFYNTEIATYIYIFSKNKPKERKGKIQLIDAFSVSIPRLKNIGDKKVDITEQCRNLIVKTYTNFVDGEFYGDNLTCVSKIFDNLDFGFNRVQVEQPLLENGNIVYKGKKMVPDPSKRDYERIPLTEDIDTYFEREILPYNKNSWIDKSKTKVVYEIPFLRKFYKFEGFEDSESIEKRILQLEKEINISMNNLFGEEE